MESQLVLGFKETASSEVFGEGNYKLVPWISWDDWSFVRESLFSSSPGSIDSALKRISTWRSRGCLPVMVEVTASIVEIQQKDPQFRNGLPEGDLLAEDMLAMLYCMTIMRLVNGIVEKNRKKNEISIAEAADVIGIPRMLIDIRHECSHRDLPSLRLVRLASTKALDWLKSYYWEPQRMAIPYPSDRRKEIKSKIRELIFSLNAKQTTRTNSSAVKGKCSKKHITKAMKNLIKLYLSFSSEVVSILLEFLLKELESSDLVEIPNSSQVGITGAYQTRLDVWKPLIIKLSNKEPEMLLSLLKAVLQTMEAQSALKCDLGENLKSKNNDGFHHSGHLSCLFEWLVSNLRDLKTRRKTTAETSLLPKSTLVDLLRKSLTVSSPGDHHLTPAALLLAQMTHNNTLVDKLHKLTSIHTTKTDVFEEPPPATSDRFHARQENCIRQAANALEFFKRKLSQTADTDIDTDTGKKARWVVAKSWKPCPIGTLPSDLGSSGVVPVLDVVDGKSAQGNGKWEMNRCRSKREPESRISVLDDSDVKKLKRSEVVDGAEGVEGRVMVGGVWKRVTDNELADMASAVRILV